MPCGLGAGEAAGLTFQAPRSPAHTAQEAPLCEGLLPRRRWPEITAMHVRRE